jgi:hypothetical protein
MSINLAKRRFLRGAGSCLSFFAVGRKAAAASALRNTSLMWSPATLCGLNMGYGEFWGRDIALGQYDVLARDGCTFVRGMFFCYLLGSYKPGQLDPAVQKITAIQPYVADPTQLSLSCESLTYAIHFWLCPSTNTGSGGPWKALSAPSEPAETREAKVATPNTARRM